MIVFKRSGEQFKADFGEAGVVRLSEFPKGMEVKMEAFICGKDDGSVLDDYLIKFLDETGKNLFFYKEDFSGAEWETVSGNQVAKMFVW
jgi:hypothetical protein